MIMSGSRIALFAVLALILSGCLDRSDEYETVDDARKSHVFDKGWLPDLLPASAYDLKVVTNVEISAGRGKFRFDPKDYPEFLAKLARYEGSMSKIDDDNESIKKLLGEGYEARAYSMGATSWIFLCEQKKAVCEFFVWQ